MLVASGEDNEQRLAREVGLTIMTVHKALRTDRLQKMIRAEVQARATLMMPKALNSAEMDMLGTDARIRSAGREFIKKTADGDGGINQTFNVWDPSNDEALWERANQLFQSKQLEDK